MIRCEARNKNLFTFRGLADFRDLGRTQGERVRKPTEPDDESTYDATGIGANSSREPLLSRLAKVHFVDKRHCPSWLLV